MGWTEMYRFKPVKDWFKDEIEGAYLVGEVKHKVLEVKIVHRTQLYAAIQQKSGNVYAVIGLLRYHKGCYNFSYKLMSEYEMPYYFKCPKSILDKLTPTTDEYAIQWREECRQYHQSKVKQR
jgi:hypothetical protein